MRDMYALFNDSHVAPQEFDRFVVKFGKLNDAIAMGNKKQIVKAAKRLEDSIDELPDVETLSYFSPDNKKGFENYLKESLEDLRETARKSELLIPEFHHVRKSIRRLISYYRISDVLRPNPENAIILEYLGGVSRKMGDMQDDFVEQSLKGKIDYDKSTVKLDEKFRSRIEAFTHRIAFQ